MSLEGEEFELGEHEKRMIAVAEGGDPNDPAENAGGERLPSEGEPSLEEKSLEEMTKEELLEYLMSDDADEDEGEEDYEDDEEYEEDYEGDEESSELEALRQQIRERNAYDAAGGQEAYGELMAWGGENLSEGEIALFNQVVNEGDGEAVKFAVEAVKARHQLAALQSDGYQGQLTEGQGGMRQAVQGYASQAEMQRDMADNRYHTDEAYRQQVAQKLAITTAF